MDDKKTSRTIIGKKVVTKTGKEFGLISNVIFDVRTGELIQVALKNTTSYCEGLELERNNQNEAMIPFTSVSHIGDFVVIDEEELF